MINIIDVKEENFNWDWDESVPGFYCKTSGDRWGVYRKFDPFPCYTHPLSCVETLAVQVEETFPIPFDVYIFNFSLEPLCRTNGMACTNVIDYSYDDLTKRTFDGVICLYGKRIPLHPAMTRYLVSHEYGHIVDEYLCVRKGLESNGLDKEYAKMRGISENSNYGGKKWHTNMGEIIANDFRIAITGTESEFWPHECKHPSEDKNVLDWWAEAKEKYSFKK